MLERKVGIFGGTFDPFHYGHLNSMVSVADKLALDEVRVMPTAQSPLRMQTEGSTPEQRVGMLRAGLAGNQKLQLDTREIDKGGVSYTFDTLKELAKDKGAQYFLVVGLDQFYKFDQWKNYAQILDMADLVVTSRPGMELPLSLEDWPMGLRQLVADYDTRQALLKSGKTIFFVQLEDVEASSTEIRRKIRIGQDIRPLVPAPVADYIAEHKLYESVQRRIGDFEKFTAFCEKVLIDKGGINVKSYDLRERTAPSEFTLIASGSSTRHATALAEHLVQEVKKEFGVWAESIEGQTEGRWIVVDYGALIVHTFYDYVRQEYRLEDLWTRPVKTAPTSDRKPKA